MRFREVPGLTVRAACSLEERERIRAVQKRVYVDRGLVDDIADPELDDRWVERSLYIGAFHHHDIVGTCRLIPHASDLHLYDIFDIDHEWSRRTAVLPMDDLCVELSSLAVVSGGPGGRHDVFAALARTLFHYCIRERRPIVIAGVTPWLARILEQVLALRIEQIGPEIRYFGAPRMPVAFDALEFMQRNRAQNTPIWQFASRGLEIDLRHEASSAALAVAGGG